MFIAIVVVVIAAVILITVGFTVGSVVIYYNNGMVSTPSNSTYAHYRTLVSDFSDDSKYTVVYYPFTRV